MGRFSNVFVATFAFGATAVALAGSAFAQKYQEVHRCDELAAHPANPNRWAKGVEDENIVPAPSLKSCTQAVEAYPSQRRLAFLAIAITVCAVLSFRHASAASFDCSRARQTAEIAVCKNPELSKLDDELAEIYAKVVAATTKKGQKHALENQQATFLTRRRDQCEMTFLA